MLKKALCSCLVIISLIILCGYSFASHTELDEISLDNYRNEQGEYVFYPLSWRMSPVEVEECLVIDLSEADFMQSVSGDLCKYTYADAVLYKTYTANIVFEFTQDQLTTVSYIFKGGKSVSEILYDELMASLCDLYGEPTRQMSNDMITYAIQWYTIVDDTFSSMALYLYANVEDASVVLYIGTLLEPLIDA